MNTDLAIALRADDLTVVSTHADALPDIDFLHNNTSNGPARLTLAWMAAFLGARKCLAHVVRRGANLNFAADVGICSYTVREIALLDREALLGLIEGGMSPNEIEIISLYASDFENELPKSDRVEFLDRLICEMPDLLDASDQNIAQIAASHTFNSAFPALFAFVYAKADRLHNEAKLHRLAFAALGTIAHSIKLLTANAGLFEESVKSHFRGYRKNRGWLRDAATKTRIELQTKLAPSLDLYEDDEDLALWIDLALARYPVREAAAAVDAISDPVRRNGLDLENRAMRALLGAGFSIEATPVTGDQGADIIAVQDGLKFVVQCKDYSTSVGNAAVQEVLGAKSFYQADYAVVCATAGYTKSAKALAATSNVLLVTPELLPELGKLRMLVE